MAGRAWIKLYERWMSSPSHEGLSGDVLGTGALWLLRAESLGKTDDDGTRWMHDAEGAPVRLDSCHRQARVRPRSGRARALAMIAVGTMVVRDDGCLGFPNYLKWQQNPSANRVREHRAKRYIDVTCNREAEAEAEVEAEAYIPDKKTPDSALPAVDDVSRLRRYVVELRNARGITSRNRTPTKTDRENVRRALRAGYSLDDIHTTIYRQYRSTAKDRDAAERYLTLSTCTTPKNLARLLSQDNLGDPTGSGSAKPKLVQIGTDWWLLYPDGHKEPADPPEDA